jgi:hypothetical protein
MHDGKEINPAASLVLDFGGSGARGIGLKIKTVWANQFFCV